MGETLEGNQKKNRNAGCHKSDRFKLGLNNRVRQIQLSATGLGRVWGTHLLQYQVALSK
jgi:hypothetical protein